jgi:hypothetical protein
MAYSEEIKQGLRHNQAEPESYIWLSDGKTLFRAPAAELNGSVNAEQKFLAAKVLFENGNKDVYITDLTQ